MPMRHTKPSICMYVYANEYKNHTPLSIYLFISAVVPPCCEGSVASGWVPRGAGREKVPRRARERTRGKRTYLVRGDRPMVLRAEVLR